MFSGRQPALHASRTRIYARVDRTHQCLIYSMHLASNEDIAMILPVPVIANAREDAMSFVDLSEYPTLFNELAALFAPPPSRLAPQYLSLSVEQNAKTLIVHEVGAFVASFVPRLVDFARLDPRFRLPDTVWSALPQYRDWGFAVFQLAKGDTKVHPMAFHFPTRDPSRIFFPTVHVHDGSVHSHAEFDHELYFQNSAAHASDTESHTPASRQMVERSQGLLQTGLVRRRIMDGHFENADVWISAY
jgi:hypothetical protein